MEQPIYLNATHGISERARDLVERMTLEEKVTQLKYDAPAIPRLGVPYYNWWNEALHGVARAGTATVFPQAIGMAATFDADLLKTVGHTIGIEGRAKYNMQSSKGDRDIYKGLTFWAPNVNIFRDPRWGRGHETYGEDPYLTARLGVGFVNGLQGDGDYLLGAACAKHYAVHSGPEAIRHEFDAEVSQKDLWETYLPAFEALVTEAHVEAVMGAYNSVNGEPSCGSKVLLQDILREQWAFKGHVVSDCWAIRDFHTHHMVTGNATESAALALNMGCDLNCGNTYLHVWQAYEQGLVTEEAITTSVTRLMETRLRLGMFDTCAYDEIGYDKVDCKEHQALNLDVAQKSLVLLRNENVLPLQKEKLKAIAVIGPNADSRMALKGNYCGTASRYVTALEGIQAYVADDVRVYYAEGCHLYKDRVEVLAFPNDRIGEAVAVAEMSDVVILSLGLDADLEGEEGDTGNSYAAGDKPDIVLPGLQQQLLEKVLDTGKPVIVLLSAGSALTLGGQEERCAAIVQTWYAGSQGGHAIANLLFGEYSPSGKLPVTFYQSTDDLPAFEDYSMKGRTYRYIEKSPLYPFGYGLSYGNAQVIRVAEPMLDSQDDGIRLGVTVYNDSERDVEDVLQVYVKVDGSVYEVPNHRLCSIKRIALKAQEKKQYEIVVSEEELKVVNSQGERIKDGKGCTFYVGTSQPDARSEALTGKVCRSVYLTFTDRVEE